MNGGNAVLALSARPWLAYSYHNRTMLTPLSYNMLEYASKFSSGECPEGIVAVSHDTLRIITVEKLGSTFHQTSVPLRYTPRTFGSLYFWLLLTQALGKMVLHAPSRTFAIIESDNRTYPMPQRLAALAVEEANKPKDDDDMETDDEDAPAKPNTELNLTIPAAPQGMWASCVRLVDPHRGATVSCLEMDPGESATCIAYCTFHDQQGEVHLVVGSALNLHLAPRMCEAGFLSVYRVTYEGLQLLHKVRTYGSSRYLVLI